MIMRHETDRKQRTRMTAACRFDVPALLAALSPNAAACCSGRFPCHASSLEPFSLFLCCFLLSSRFLVGKGAGLEQQ